MAGPLFIRQPVTGMNPFPSPPNGRAIFGQILPGAPTAWAELLYDVQEPMLVEEIRWSALDHATTGDGQIIIAVVNVDYGGAVYYCIVGAYPVVAGVAAPGPYASGRIRTDLALPVGFSLYVAHSIKIAGGAAYAWVDITAHGGIVR